MEIIFDGERTVEGTGEHFHLRNLDQYWAIRAAYTTIWFICWILFHYRARPEIQTLIGVRWMTFFLNVTFISAACIFLISSAWGFEYVFIHSTFQMSVETLIFNRRLCQ